jgi:hypothetical protein
LFSVAAGPMLRVAFKLCSTEVILPLRAYPFITSLFLVRVFAAKAEPAISTALNKIPIKRLK